ncbi:DEAD/DEAH box helicase family protein [Limosilactobacillus reuteri]|uniref:restriction endonuclease n=1 Tax=Limosilactobacillus reuteri TaxID=1598 RepID=UPI001E5530E4|nr:DEAD/DEAH box helicase family protein [Limosilactobacillus reuteri]MCC4419984.1 DEAD/DEAH box helicase family protein [Limosilactobacillus reuteri]
MILDYEKLPYQHEAVKAVIDTLSGHDDLTNKIVLDLGLLDESVQATLLNNSQKYPGPDYLKPFPQFNIEMETGTGKTMVYLQTIMALHKRFCENKFVIVVPSKAIKAGVEDNLDKLKVYLSNLYNTEKYNYFVYDSKQISELQNFAGSSFEIMLTTVQAFNKSTNVINQEYNEGFFGGRPLDQIRDAHPIVIIDEPQSVDGAKAGKEAIASLNPKFTIRYSATHKDRQYPLLYEFGPAQAYQNHMVKHIETLGTDVNTNGNVAFIQLKEEPIPKGTSLQAKVLVYKQVGDEFKKRTITLNQNDSLFKKTKNPQYKSWGRVVEINRADNFVEFENGKQARLGDNEGETQIWIQSQMEALIRDHLDRELLMQDQGIKVLSLIFLDEVKNYRVYTAYGAKKGKYAELFENIYKRVLHSNSKYKKLYNYDVPAEEVHDGYFAQDKATKKKPAMYRDTKGDTQKDETAYKAIMEDKEGLLTQYVPRKPETDTKAAKLRFIFSHSALKEGWDNPNVFQIMTITTPKNDLTRRQKIGRGLRIPVNQNGKRVYNEKQNTVTIYASESFEEFANGLQKEYIDDGLISNKIDENTFAGLIVERHSIENGNDETNDIPITDLDDQTVQSDQPKAIHKITHEESKIFAKVLQEMEVTNDKGYVILKGLRSLTKKKKKEVVEHTVEKGINRESATSMMDYFASQHKTPVVENRKNRKRVNVVNKNNQYLNNLWNMIAKKVNYRVVFKENELINDIVYGDNSLANIQLEKMTAIQTRAKININKANVTNELLSTNTEHIENSDLPILDITRQLADQVGLTRQAIIQMILKTNKIKPDFIKNIKLNPTLFVQRAKQNIKAHEKRLLNQSLVYVLNGEKWSQNELKPYTAAENTLWSVPDRGLSKTLFDKIAVDSQEEIKFAKQLVNEEKIKYFLKLPHWFKIPTPFGNYNPDWAILAEKKDAERLYFIADTKSTTDRTKLRNNENAKIEAGKKAYEAKGMESIIFKAPIVVVGNLNL